MRIRLITLKWKMNIEYQKQAHTGATTRISIEVGIDLRTLLYIRSRGAQKKQKSRYTYMHTRHTKTHDYYPEDDVNDIRLTTHTQTDKHQIYRHTFIHAHAQTHTLTHFGHEIHLFATLKEKETVFKKTDVIITHSHTSRFFVFLTITSLCSDSSKTTKKV